MLRDWLEKRGMRHKAFAGLLGLSAGYLSDLISGAKKPSLFLALRIDLETGGAVGPHSWYSAAELTRKSAGETSSDRSICDHAGKDAPVTAASQGNEVAS